MRLSAVGDVCHALPVVRSLMAAWPETRFTWVIGRLEAGLLGDIPGIEFITFDKSQGRHAYRQLRGRLAGRRFDLLLQMQVSLRASMACLTGVRAARRLGFDRARARDFQWLFTNEKIAARKHEHVMDSLFGFADAVGVHERELRWDIPLGDSDRALAEHHIPDGTPTLVMSPLSSPRLRNWRNWRLERYAAVADYAAGQGLKVILTGGPSTAEREAGESIASQCDSAPVNLIGQTNLKQLFALIERARVVISPDSGPVHMATAAGTSVIGLYATSNPDRTGPYFCRQWVVNRYPEALHKFNNKTPETIRWGTRVRHPDAMGLIQVDDVTAMLDTVVVSG